MLIGFDWTVWRFLYCSELEEQDQEASSLRMWNSLYYGERPQNTTRSMRSIDTTEPTQCSMPHAATPPFSLLYVIELLEEAGA